MYDELIKNLRHDSVSALQNCEFDFVHDWMLKAADAIEELSKKIDRAVSLYNRIPPHGRLIDADALLNLLNHCMFPSDMVTTTALSMATNWIKEAPTIIESEGE